MISVIGPIVSFGSEVAYLVRTYSYTRVDKQFLKYENNIVYTTDGCEYEDKNNKFETYVFDSQYARDVIVSQGSRVEVYTSDLTGECFQVVINAKQIITEDYSSSFAFGLYENNGYNDYIYKREETNNFLTFSALVVALFVFIATAVTVFFTNNSKKRFLYVLFYVVAILIGIFKSFFAVSMIASVLYGMMAYYLTRRILIPNFIFASVHMIISSIGMYSCVKNPFDFLVQGCSFVIFSYVGAVVVWIFQKMSDNEGNRFSKLFIPFNEFNPDKDNFYVKNCPAFIVLLIEVALLYGVSTQRSGDYGGLVFGIPSMMIIPPLYGLIAYLCTSRIILPHAIFSMIVFPCCVLSSVPNFNHSSGDILAAAFRTTCILTIYSLAPAILIKIIRAVVKKKEKSKKKLKIDG